ncbi:hypothetical protein K470DRAFT_276147 [Piedraia hortae CBS 480.64]|uniref:Altered inheritance of mitochondria protein 11 n=1 Tax=Piedraia hortae CBS 480.64 TaxID=1314780 RepID=A0A6A7C1P3_9PEZI|nr:hypothetical protein K470DRAFT_276147 [Piedraia hortae CBS 480.64]
MCGFWALLEPGDVRAQRRNGNLESLSCQLSQPLSQQPPSQAPHPKQPPDGLLSPAARRDRQNNAFYTGVAGTVFSALLTRRVIRAKRLPFPSTSTSGVNSEAPGVGASKAHVPNIKVLSGIDAIQALGLATLNVCSIATLIFGAVAKIFDLAEVEDLRHLVRRGVGYDVYGGDAKGDEEVEQWLESLLKEGGISKEGIESKLRELEREERKSKGAPSPEPVRIVEQLHHSETGKLRPTQDSANPYVNGTKKWDGRTLCTRCGQVGHTAVNCLYAPLKEREQSILRQMVERRR